ncbi:hypothetical protein H2200_011138 [Cladophialophora chaetospira]|uniref:ubiquitinyl hydrolase 1 n=1 Tax=Cladophialophora chaetospira TaxID=386627 RepID=A0AA38X023_9EURO|nr:hypothetical protein H2200_011138 [Cladophialophora chaetospira]
MNNHPDRADESPFHESISRAQNTSSPIQTKIVSTLALLVLGYYALSFFDAWPSTIKRTIYEFILYYTPSRLIYAMQYGLLRLGYLTPEDAKFKPANFGDMIAKQEAMRRMFGQPQLPLALQKVRSLSGPFISLSNEIGPPGLGNWDNSCYQNSVLQGFASLPAFVDYMERSESLCDRYDIPAATHRALVAFLEQLADSSCRTSVIWTPRVLKSMDSWQQQDAQEYFSRVLEAVEKETKQYATRLRRTNTAGLECLSPIEKQEATTKSTGEREISSLSGTGGDPASVSTGLWQRHLHNPIEGMTAQCLLCKTCGFTEGLALTQFNCLTLNLGLQDETDIENLLEEYTAPEEIEGVECDNCTKLVHTKLEHQQEHLDNDVAMDTTEQLDEKKKPVLRTKAKQITIGRLPKDLVLHINRSIFDNYGNQLKNTAPVRFPARLDFLSRWCAPLDIEDDSVEATYELKCAVTHYGSHHDGHYIALGKRAKDWYTFNDERVTKISEEEVLARGNAFMLFYEAIPMVSPPKVQEETMLQEATATVAAEIDREEIEAGFAPVHQGRDQHSLHGAADTASKASTETDEGLVDSQSEFGLTSDVSQYTTPASSENSSPVDAEVGNEHVQENKMKFAGIKTVSEVLDTMQDEHAREAPAAPVL